LTKEVVIEPYRPEWSERFEHEREQIRAALRGRESAKRNG